MNCQNNIPLIPGSLAVVVGAGRSGLAAARLLGTLGLKVRILEKKNNPSLCTLAQAEGWELLLGEHSSEQFKGAAVIIPSPGVPVSALLPFLPAEAQNLIMGEMELAYTQLVARKSKEAIIAITGTSGKTTTASICAAMLEEAGKKVFLGGNIGVPLSEYLLASELAGAQTGERPNALPNLLADVLVLEVSSFQLQTCRSFRPNVAMLLNISENHLDYHADMAEYSDAKFKLFACQTSSDYAIFPEEMRADALVQSLAAQKIFFKTGNNFPNTSLLGQHNQLNLEAAWQAVHALELLGLEGLSLQAAQNAAANFQAIEHRLERLPEINGVMFVNDSKSTTVDSLRVALNAMNRPVLLLAGGVFKGGDLTALIPLIKEKVRAVGLFGASREVFETAWQSVTDVSWSPSLEEACKKLLAKAQRGDVLLLSPATASFDLYSNYKERGNDFKRIWESLQ